MMSSIAAYRCIPRNCQKCCVSSAGEATLIFTLWLCRGRTGSVDFSTAFFMDKVLTWFSFFFKQFVSMFFTDWFTISLSSMTVLCFYSCWKYFTQCQCMMRALLLLVYKFNMYLSQKASKTLNIVTFSSYFLWNLRASDEIWFAVSWLNVLQNSINIPS